MDRSAHYCDKVCNESGHTKPMFSGPERKPATCPVHPDAPIGFTVERKVVGCLECGKTCSWRCYSNDCHSPRHYLQPTPTRMDFCVVKMT